MILNTENFLNYICFFYLYMYVFVYVCLTTCVQDSMEARRGVRSPRKIELLADMSL